MGNPFSHLEDSELMKLYINGDYMAFEVIYLRHKNKVYSYLDKRLFDKNHIDDVFQSVFVKFHKSKNLYNSKYSLLQWLYTITRSELLDFLKKNKIQEVEFEENLLTQSENVDTEQIDLDSISTLSTKEKEAIKLRYLSEEDFTAISKILNTTEANSRKLVSRGIKKLKAKLIGVSK